MYYTVLNNIGKSKYVLKYDTDKKHKDGSMFRDIEIFKNKIKLKNRIKELINLGYKLN